MSIIDKEEEYLSNISSSIQNGDIDKAKMYIIDKISYWNDRYIHLCVNFLETVGLCRYNIRKILSSDFVKNLDDFDTYGRLGYWRNILDNFNIFFG